MNAQGLPGASCALGGHSQLRGLAGGQECLRWGAPRLVDKTPNAGNLMEEVPLFLMVTEGLMS